MQVIDTFAFLFFIRHLDPFSNFSSLSVFQKAGRWPLRRTYLWSPFGLTWRHRTPGPNGWIIVFCFFSSACLHRLLFLRDFRTAPPSELSCFWCSVLCQFLAESFPCTDSCKPTQSLPRVLHWKPMPWESHPAASTRSELTESCLSWWRSNFFPPEYCKLCN